MTLILLYILCFLTIANYFVEANNVNNSDINMAQLINGVIDYDLENNMNQSDNDLYNFQNSDNYYLRYKEIYIMFDKLKQNFKDFKEEILEKIYTKAAEDKRKHENLTNIIQERNLTKINENQRNKYLEEKFTGFEAELQSRDTKQNEIHENLFKTLNELKNQTNKQNDIKKTLKESERIKNIEIQLKKLNDNYIDMKNDLTNKQNEISKTVEETREQLINIEISLNEKIEKTNQELKQTKGELNAKITNTSEELNKTKVKFNTLSDNLFNKWLHFKLFTDSDGKRKAFFIPLNESSMKFTFDEAINTCNKYNATLVEPKTAQKQQLFESFLGQLGLESYKIYSYNGHYYINIWINAKRDSLGKFRWISSGEQFTFTNWNTGFPVSNSNCNYVYITSDLREAYIKHFGVWVNDQRSAQFSVVCEQQIYI